MSEKEIKVPKFNAENAWASDQDKYQFIGYNEYENIYNDVVKYHKERGSSDKEIQTNLNKRLTRADYESPGGVLTAPGYYDADIDDI